MKYVMTLTSVLLIVTTAQATTLSEIWFSEDWESDTPGTLVTQANQWDGQWPDYPDPGNSTWTVQSGGWDGNYANLAGDDNDQTGENYAWTDSTFDTVSSQSSVHIFEFEARKGGIDSGNRTRVYLLDEGGAPWLMWYGGADHLIARIGDGAQLGTADLSDGQVHLMTITYDPVSGIANWYKDGGLVASSGAGTGKYAERIEMRSQFATAADAVQIDNLQIGVPEPTALLLCGFGSLALLRRKRS